MKTLSRKPHFILWVVAIILFLILLPKGNKTLDIQLHDTYFVFSFLQYAGILSLFLIIQGVVYGLVINRKLINWMTVVHVVGSCIITSIFVINLAIQGNNYFLPSSPFITLGVLFFLILQLLFTANIAIALIKKR